MEAQLSLFLRRNKKAADEERIKWEEGEDLGHRSLRPPLKGKAPPWDLLIFPSSFNCFYPVSGCWILIVVDDPVVFSRLRCPSQFLPFPLLLLVPSSAVVHVVSYFRNQPEPSSESRQKMWVNGIRNRASGG
jgi:hypothetical protein